MTRDPKNPIGIFDSGIGGLTVFAAVRRHLPQEPLIYLGDTARVPYGTKSAETIIRYARECTSFLVERRVKAIVVACNTASAYALPELARDFDIPVLGVIEPGAKAAIAATRNKAIGVIGTSGTISSNAYGKELKKLDPAVRIVSRPCPLFVPLVEEGWTENDVADAAARNYLGSMREEGIDTLVLGCTHYPLIAGVIKKALDDGVKLVDSAETTAVALAALLDEHHLAADGKSQSGDRIYVTDLPGQFETIARRFLGDGLPSVVKVDL